MGASDVARVKQDARRRISLAKRRAEQTAEQAAEPTERSAFSIGSCSEGPLSEFLTTYCGLAVT